MRELEHCFDEGEEVTDNGLGLVLDRLRTGDYNDVQLKLLVERAQGLTQGDPRRILELRRTLIGLFGSRFGDESRVILPFLNAAGQEECLFI